MANILYVEDDYFQATGAEGALTRLGHAVRLFSSWGAAEQELLSGKFKPDVVVSDFDLGKGALTGYDGYTIVRAHHPAMPFVAITSLVSQYATALAGAGAVTTDSNGQVTAVNDPNLYIFEKLSPVRLSAGMQPFDRNLSAAINQVAASIAKGP